MEAPMMGPMSLMMCHVTQILLRMTCAFVGVRNGQMMCLNLLHLGLCLPPKSPTRAERERHEDSGHVMYESWCPHCVKVRALDSQHRRRDPEEAPGEYPLIGFGVCFPGQLDAPVKMPVLVSREDRHWGRRPMDS